MGRVQEARYGHPSPVAGVRLAPARPVYEATKRGFDIAFALLLGAVLTPVWLPAAVLVRLTSRGPVLLRQPRCGRGGRVFGCWKFRTMVAGADRMQDDLRPLNEAEGPVFKIRRDPRVTPAGRWLRKLSIDELPQLLNVLRGEMSIVGPRPPLVPEVLQYGEREHGRLAVKPGLTCLWQVSGRSLIGFERWVELDLEYIRRRGFWYDLWLVLRTVPVVVMGKGAF